MLEAYLFEAKRASIRPNPTLMLQGKKIWTILTALRFFGSFFACSYRLYPESTELSSCWKCSRKISKIIQKCFCWYSFWVSHDFIQFHPSFLAISTADSSLELLFGSNKKNLSFDAIRLVHNVVYFKWIELFKWEILVNAAFKCHKNVTLAFFIAFHWDLIFGLVSHVFVTFKLHLNVIFKLNSPWYFLIKLRKYSFNIQKINWYICYLSNFSEKSLIYLHSYILNKGKFKQNCQLLVTNFNWKILITIFIYNVMLYEYIFQLKFIGLMAEVLILNFNLF